MLIRSKAPLRLGLVGGGTDVSPYCDEYGGMVLNVTIDRYAYCTIEPTHAGSIIFSSRDRGESFECESKPRLDIDGRLALHKGIYNRIVSDFTNGEPLSFKMTTYADAPAGSGLGSSSTMAVAIIKAYIEWLNLPLGEYELAALAYEIERVNLQLTGGRQDHFAVAFGGFNFIEFYENNRVIVNPLRIKNWIKNEVESSLVLFNTGTSRDSSKIIEDQIKNTALKVKSSIEGMHELKSFAVEMKNAILKGEFHNMTHCLQQSWASKKKTSAVISNPQIDEMYRFIMENGGKAAKITGAGGGGFMMILCDPIERYTLIEKLRATEGTVMLAHFTEKGAQAWTILYIDEARKYIFRRFDHGSNRIGRRLRHPFKIYGVRGS